MLYCRHLHDVLYILPPGPVLDLRAAPTCQRYLHRHRAAADDDPHHVLALGLVERLVLRPGRDERKVSRHEVVTGRFRVLIGGTGEENATAGDGVYYCIYRVSVTGAMAIGACGLPCSPWCWTVEADLGLAVMTGSTSY